MTSRLRPRVALAVAAALAVSVTLTGCLQWFLPPSPTTTSQPTGEEVDAELRPFYEQVLQWSSCGNGMQCTTATAPMDWEDPSAASIDLALVRQTATSGTAIGSLLVNPGGPGGSGWDFVYDSVDFAVSEDVQARYDVVGFDPRGVGRSSAVSCYDDPAFMDWYNYSIIPGEPGTDAWIADVTAANQQFADSCREHTGPLLGFVDTVSAARDLDLLRAVLGDEKLNFLGYSYGTFLGATYADLYPGKTGRLVLDGALDPATSDFDVTRTQAVGFESAYRAYLADCLTRAECPFTGSVDDAIAQTRAVLDGLEAAPLPGPDGRLLGSGAMFTAIILPLYRQDTWSFLDDLFTEVRAGQTGTAFYLADYYNGRNSDGTYRDNSTEAFLSINCLDYRSDVTPESMRAEAALLAEAAPLFGPAMSWGGTLCKVWPFTSHRDRVAITAPGSADILVIGTTNDPATPYVWAVAMADQLQNGHLVTFNGEGHTAYNGESACIDATVDAYLLQGTVPAADPMC